MSEELTKYTEEMIRMVEVIMRDHADKEPITGSLCVLHSRASLLHHLAREDYTQGVVDGSFMGYRLSQAWIDENFLKKDQLSIKGWDIT